MRRSIFRLLAAACLCLMTYGTGFAQRITATLLLTDSAPAYGEVAEALRGELERVAPGAAQWDIATVADPKPPASRLTVTVGRAALAAALNGSRENGGPILAALVPRLAFERETRLGTPRGPLSAIVLDQPPARLIALVRAALPQARRIGMLVGADSRHLAGAFRAAALEQGMTLQTEDVEKSGVFEALRVLLEESDVLLAIADPSIYNDETIAGILGAGYRRRVPLIGFSPAYVKAGALIGLYATPAQVGRAAASAVREYLASGVMASPAAPAEFSIRVNDAVARSLGLNLTEEEIRKSMRQFERRQ